MLLTIFCREDLKLSYTFHSIIPFSLWKWVKFLEKNKYTKSFLKLKCILCSQEVRRIHTESFFLYAFNGFIEVLPAQ